MIEYNTYQTFDMCTVIIHVCLCFLWLLRIEGWTAVPMSYESMSIIEGKIKLPMMRGEHSPSVQHFKAMEQNMADNLRNWLCNIYIEVTNISTKISIL